MHSFKHAPLAVTILGTIFVCLTGSAAENKPEKTELKVPQLLQLDPVKEDRPDIDSKAMAELHRLRRARYNVALQDLQVRWKLYQGGKVEQSEVLAALGRLQKAEYYLPGRARDGVAGAEAGDAWLAKKFEFLRYWEELVQRRYEEGGSALHELFEVQFHRLDAEEDLAEAKVAK